MTISNDGVGTGAGHSNLALSNVGQRLTLLSAHLRGCLRRLGRGSLIRATRRRLSRLSSRLNIRDSLLRGVTHLDRRIRRLRTRGRHVLSRNSREDFPSSHRTHLVGAHGNFLPTCGIRSIMSSRRRLVNTVRIASRPGSFRSLRPSVRTVRRSLRMRMTRTITSANCTGRRRVLTLRRRNGIVTIPFGRKSRSPGRSQRRKVFFACSTSGSCCVYSRRGVLPVGSERIHGRKGLCEGCRKESYGNYPLVGFYAASGGNQVVCQETSTRPVERCVGGYGKVGCGTLVQLQGTLMRRPFKALGC